MPDWYTVQAPAALENCKLVIRKPDPNRLNQSEYTHAGLVHCPGIRRLRKLLISHSDTRPEQTQPIRILLSTDSPA